MLVEFLPLSNMHILQLCHLQEEVDKTCSRFWHPKTFFELFVLFHLFYGLYGHYFFFRSDDLMVHLGAREHQACIHDHLKFALGLDNQYQL